MSVRFNNIEGILYDLDGTIIETRKIHEYSWLYAGKIHGVTITQQMLIDQKGMGGLEAASKILPRERHDELDAFHNTRKERDNDLFKSSDIQLCTGFMRANDFLYFHGMTIGVCTSADEEMTDIVFEKIPLLQFLKSNTVCREQYARAKPAPDGILCAAEVIKVSISKTLYVGDALADYTAATNAGIPFVYFCEERDVPDKRIPKDVPRIIDHQELINLIN